MTSWCTDGMNLNHCAKCQGALLVNTRIQGQITGETRQRTARYRATPKLPHTLVTRPLSTHDVQGHSALVLASSAAPFHYAALSLHSSYTTREGGGVWTLALIQKRSHLSPRLFSKSTEIVSQVFRSFSRGINVEIVLISHLYVP